MAEHLSYQEAGSSPLHSGNVVCQIGAGHEKQGLDANEACLWRDDAWYASVHSAIIVSASIGRTSTVQAQSLRLHDTALRYETSRWISPTLMPVQLRTRQSST